MSEALVSVIIPSYNRAGKIINSAQSVLNQTYKNLELIIVDDGSTDNTSEKVSALDDIRVRYIQLPTNLGACAARNRGINEAKGEYVAFQDSDDVWLPNKIELQIRYLETTNADLVYCGMERRNSTSVKLVPQNQNPGDEPSLELLLTSNKISTQTMFMKREVADKVLFDISFRRLQDWDFSLRAVAAGYKVKFMGEILVISVVQEDSITYKVFSEQAYLHLLERHKSEYNLFPKAKARVYYIIAYRYKGMDNQKVKEYLRKSYSLQKNPVTLIRLIMSYLGLWR